MHLWGFLVYSGKNVNQIVCTKEVVYIFSYSHRIESKLLLPLCPTSREKLHILLFLKKLCFSEFTPGQLQATVEQGFVQKVQQLCPPCLYTPGTKKCFPACKLQTCRRISKPQMIMCSKESESGKFSMS